MLKALIRKQFMEAFRGYFVDQKTGKARTKAGVIGMFVLFAVLLLILCGAFFSVAAGIGFSLISLGMDWLYFALMGLLAVALGTFGSVFNTFSALYLAKDNEMLLSMPIPPRTILLSRMTVVYGLSLMYSAIAWLPAIAMYWIVGSPGAVSVLFELLLLPIIALFVTVLTSALGWLVALISTRIKNRSYLTVLLTLVFLGVYYSVCFRFSDFIESLINNSDKVGSAIQNWLNFIYQLGRAACGNVGSMLLFTAVTGLLFAVCIWILSRSFFGIVSRSEASSAATVKSEGFKARSEDGTLLKRELRRFTSSATYMLNCGLGIAILPILAVAAIWKYGDIRELLEAFSLMVPDLSALKPLIVLLAVCTILALNDISTPSVSLEGKNLWILQSLPVHPSRILAAKVKLHFLLNAIPAVPVTVILGICLGCGAVEIVETALFAAIFAAFTAMLGLIIGLKYPNLNWTTETVPIKQSMNVLVSWLCGWAAAILVCGGGYLLKNYLDIRLYLFAACVLVFVCCVLLNRWIRTAGAREFRNL